MSVVVPVLAPEATTLTPIRGSPVRSVTVPRMLIVCADRKGIPATIISIKNSGRVR